MKSGFLAIGRRCAHQSVLLVTANNAWIETLNAVESELDGFDIVVTDPERPKPVSVRA